MILERIIRGKPAKVIFSHIPDVLSSQKVKVMKQEHRSLEDRFTGSIEGSKEGAPHLIVKVKVEGGKEPWSHIGGNFIPQIHTSHLTVETFEVTGKGHEESEGSLELLKELDAKLNLYLWHTAG